MVEIRSPRTPSIHKISAVDPQTDSRSSPVHRILVDRARGSGPPRRALSPWIFPLENKSSSNSFLTYLHSGPYASV
jgi:hypothetical protein